jgi:cytochrome c-type biogenesis protein CcmE
VTSTVSSSTPQPPAARPKRKFKARYIVASVLCVGVIAWLLIGGLYNNIVYLRPVSYAVTHRADEGTKTFRMAGQVKPGTIEAIKGGSRFVMFDDKASAVVDLQGSASSLFRNCAPVVVDGRWNGTTFLGDQLLIRHGAEYSKDQRKADEAAEKKNKGCAPAEDS